MKTTLSTRLPASTSRTRSCSRRRAHRVGREHHARFEAGWGGVVVKTIGMHPVVNVKGPKTKFCVVRRQSYACRWRSARTRAPFVVERELISDKPLDWGCRSCAGSRLPFPTRSSSRRHGGTENDKEVNHWRELATACQEQGVDAFELNLSARTWTRGHGVEHRQNVQLIDTVVRAVKEVARKPIWVQADADDDQHRERGGGGVQGGGGRDLVLEHVHLAAADPPGVARVRGQTSTARSVRRPRRSRDPAAVTREDGADDDGFPARNFSGIGGHLGLLAGAELLLLGCGTAQVCTAAMLDHAIGPNVIRGCCRGMQAFPNKHADKGWHSLEEFRSGCAGIASSRIRHQAARDEEYHGGHDAPEGYAAGRPKPGRRASCGGTWRTPSGSSRSIVGFYRGGGCHACARHRPSRPRCSRSSTPSCSAHCRIVTSRRDSPRSRPTPPIRRRHDASGVLDLRGGTRVFESGRGRRQRVRGQACGRCRGGERRLGDGGLAHGHGRANRDRERFSAGRNAARPRPRGASHSRYWTRRFQRDPAAVGRPLNSRWRHLHNRRRPAADHRSIRRRFSRRSSQRLIRPTGRAATST